MNIGKAKAGEAGISQSVDDQERSVGGKSTHSKCISTMGALDLSQRNTINLQKWRRDTQPAKCLVLPDVLILYSSRILAHILPQCDKPCLTCAAYRQRGWRCCSATTPGKPQNQTCRRSFNPICHYEDSLITDIRTTRNFLKEYMLTQATSGTGIEKPHGHLSGGELSFCIYESIEAIWKRAPCQMLFIKDCSLDTGSRYKNMVSIT